MLVKLNGTLFDTERVLRFTPKTICKMEFRPEDVTTPEELWERYLSLGREATRARAAGEIFENSSVYDGWYRDSMGWRFLFWTDGYGNTFPLCFAPLSGKLEIVEDRGIKAIWYALDHGMPLE